jgi:hypothetical protein
MSSELTEITGAETRAGDGSPLDALIDFRDPAGLAACRRPMPPRLRLQSVTSSPH